MAQFIVHPPESLIKQLNSLGNRTDDISKQMLNEGIKPLKKELQKNLVKHKQSGELFESLQEKSPSKTKDGTWRKLLTFDGEAKGKSYNRKGSSKRKGGYYTKKEAYRNYQKVLALEYGTAKQPATPVIRPSVITAEDACIQQMQNVFDREVSKS